MATLFVYAEITNPVPGNYYQFGILDGTTITPTGSTFDELSAPTCTITYTEGGLPVGGLNLVVIVNGNLSTLSSFYYTVGNSLTCATTLDPVDNNINVFFNNPLTQRYVSVLIDGGDPPPVPFCVDCAGGVAAGWIQYDQYSCYRETTAPATSPVSVLSLSAITDTIRQSSFGLSGTRFFGDDFNINGSGTTIVGSSESVPLWRNSYGDGYGPLNRSGLWTTSPTFEPYDTWVGFSACLTGITTEKLYWVGIAADNNFKLILDGVTILNTLGGPFDQFTNTDAFSFWNVYPVVIGAGSHVLEVYGLNNEAQGGFGCEIYDNTLAQLTAATDYSQINVIFTSSGKTVANLVQTTGGTYTTSGYTCPTGYVYSECSGMCISYEFCQVIEPTPTPTPTPPVTQTPTQTPTMPCPCEYYDVDITENDILSATGNTGPNAFRNGVVFVTFRPCSAGTSQTIQYTVSGFYDSAFCHDNMLGITIDVWQNDIQIPYTSSATANGNCCSSITPTPTPTSTETLPPTPTNTETPTPTETPIVGVTPTQTPSNTSTETPTQTPTPTNTETPTQTETQTQTPTQTETQTQTPSETPTNTPTPTVTQIYQTLSYDNIEVTATTGSGVYVLDNNYLILRNSVEIFRVTGNASGLITQSLVPGDDVLIYSWSQVDTYPPPPFSAGTATRYLVISETSTGNIVSSQSQQYGFTPPPQYSLSYSYTIGATPIDYTIDSYIVWVETTTEVQFVDCSNPLNVFRFNDPSGTIITGDTYYINSPSDFVGCATAVVYDGSGPLYTSILNATAVTGCGDAMCPVYCPYNEYCFDTGVIGLQGYSGNYVSTGLLYFDKYYYTGGTTNIGVIYFNGTEWCLGDGLDPSTANCLITGSSPCNSICPDISSNGFTVGPCIPPTPTPTDCSVFDFNAIFNCDYTPGVSPTPSVPCEDVNFVMDEQFLTPTPTPTPTQACLITGVNFILSAYTPSITPTLTYSPTLTPTKTVPVGGQVSFLIFGEQFDCASVKVLIDCYNGVEYYIADNVEFGGTPIVTGITINAILNGQSTCLYYDRDDFNISSNAVITEVVNVYGSCDFCVPGVTQTPTITSTVTQTTTPTTTPTPTFTPTNQTPTPTPSVSGTNPPTPSVTTSQTATPTPSPTYVYVFESCFNDLASGYKYQVIQTVQVPGVVAIGSTIKSANRCWRYLGRFDSNYVAPVNVISTNYNGNYFSSTDGVIYSSCVLCESQVLPQTGCIIWDVDVSYVGLPDFCGGYDRVDRELRVRLLDEVTFASKIATEDIVVNFEVSHLNCSGGFNEIVSVVIPTGSSEGIRPITYVNYDICPITENCAIVSQTVTNVIDILPTTVINCFGG